MARYVLLEFDDNAQAKAFVAKVNGDYHVVEMGEGTKPLIRVRGVWGKPTLFCECTKMRAPYRGMRPFRHAPKSGWWVCAQCGRPTKAWAKGNHWASALGRNLLPGNKDHNPHQTAWGLLDESDASGANIVPQPSEPTEAGQQKAMKRRARSAARKGNPRRMTPPGVMQEDPEWYKS